jgi:CRP/FNR family cyclic AMP-dependent transcriptional regulator
MHEVGSDERVKLLRDVWLFERCSTSELAAIARLASGVAVEPGTVLATEGTPGHEFVVVVEGTASVLRRGAEVGQIGPGMFFGELALLDGGPRTATVRALTPMQALVLDRSAFDELVDRAIPSVARRMLVTLAERFRSEQARWEQLHARRLSLPPH